jgi:hypothetical protein
MRIAEWGEGFGWPDILGAGFKCIATEFFTTMLNCGALRTLHSSTSSSILQYVEATKMREMETDFRHL